MVSRIIKLVILALIIHAGYRIGPVFLANVQFRDAVRETALQADTPSFSGRRVTPDQVLDRLAKAARDLKVPLDREDFSVRTENKTTIIDARYTVNLEYLPRQFYPYVFVVHEEGGASRYRATTQ